MASRKTTEFEVRLTGFSAVSSSSHSMGNREDESGANWGKMSRQNRRRYPVHAFIPRVATMAFHMLKANQTIGTGYEEGRL